MVSSLLAEMVPTWAIISPETACDILSSAPLLAVAVFVDCAGDGGDSLLDAALQGHGFAPAATVFTPSRKMAWARTVAVVVPSPATSEVLEATSRTICAPMFSSGPSVRFPWRR